MSKTTYIMTLKRMMMTVLMMLITVSAMSAEQKIWLHISGNGKAQVSLGETVLTFDKDNMTTVKEDAPGKTVTVSVEPDNGYTVTSVTAQLTTDAGNADTRGADDAGFLDVKKASDTEYTFEMPKDFNVRIYVTISKKEGESKNPDPEPEPDFSGTYYLANNNSDNFKGYNDVDNFYLCPGEVYYNNGAVETTDNGKPLMTTFKTGQNDESLWIVEKVTAAGFTNYYTFKQKAGENTYKYLTVHDKLTSYDENRMRVHLEQLATNELTDRNYFSITYITEKEGGIKGYSIGCVDAYRFVNGSTINQYLNPAAGNKNQKTPTKDKNNTGGMVGFYTIGTTNTDAKGSVWFFEVPKPVIHIDDNYKLTFTCANADVTIQYTIDGGDPSTTGTNATDGIQLTEGVHTITAKAIMNSGNTDYASGVITKIVKIFGTGSYLIQNVECADFYMIPGDINGSNTEVNTSSLFRPTMAWTISYAGSENGFLYYYIMNGTSYLYHTSDGKVYMKSSGVFDADADKTGYMFSIEQGYDADSNSDGFHIVPKEKSSDNTYCIYKGGWNKTTTPLTLANSKADVMKGSTNARRGEQNHTRWKFIEATDNKLPVSQTYDSEDPTDENWPTFLSSSTATKYFKIENVGTAGRYICPPTGEAAVGTATTGDNELAWYVVEAGHDDWQKYYYIVHASTGKYLKFNQEISSPPSSMAGKNSVLSLLDFDSSTSDRYQFVFAKSTIEGAYYIVPKGLEDATYNSYYALYLDGENPIKSNKNRATDSYKWKFVAADLFCNNPVFEEKTVGEEKKISISCTTNAAKIYYTTDGTDPTASSTLYSNSITSPASDENMVIRAIAIVSDGTNSANSEIVTMLYNPDIVLEAGSYAYNGSAWEPEVTEVSVTKGENKITAPTSPATYEVASTDYTNNISASTNENKAKVTVRDVEGDTWYIWHASKEFTIEKKEIGLTWAPLDTSEPPLTSFVYNGIAQTPTATATDLVGTDECTLTVTVSANEGSSLTEDNAINVGSYIATASALSNANYKLPEDITRAFTITRAPVTVTADNKTKGYGDDEPVLTATVTGMVNNESTELITYTLSRAEGDSYGDYTITPAGDAEQGNYSVNYVTGTLTIGAKAIGDGTTPAEGITIDITYDGTYYQVTVKQGDNLLEEGKTKDYTWTGTGTDTYVVTVTGHGNYSNSAQATYFNVPFYDTTPDDNDNTETAAAYCASQNLQPSGDIKAWYVTKLENNVLTIKEVKVVEGENEINYIPANQPVLLLGDANSNGFALKPYSGTTMDFPAEGEEDANILKVVTDEGGKAVDLAEVYVFSKGEFVLTMAGTLSKGKFYLENPSPPASSRSTLSTTRGETSGINNPQLSKKIVPNTDMWYSLDGQRFNNKPTRKGLYLQNGKKVVIK